MELKKEFLELKEKLSKETNPIKKEIIFHLFLDKQMNYIESLDDDKSFGVLSNYSKEIENMVNIYSIFEINRMNVNILNENDFDEYLSLKDGETKPYTYTSNTASENRKYEYNLDNQLRKQGLNKEYIRTSGNENYNDLMDTFKFESNYKDDAQHGTSITTTMLNIIKVVEEYDMGVLVDTKIIYDNKEFVEKI